MDILSRTVQEIMWAFVEHKTDFTLMTPVVGENLERFHDWYDDKTLDFFVCSCHGDIPRNIKNLTLKLDRVQQEEIKLYYHENCLHESKNFNTITQSVCIHLAESLKPHFIVDINRRISQNKEPIK